MNHVQITNDSIVGNTAKLTIGGVIIPFYEAQINLKVGEISTITVKAPIEMVDVQALQESTMIELVDTTKEDLTDD